MCLFFTFFIVNNWLSFIWLFFLGNIFLLWLNRTSTINVKYIEHRTQLLCNTHHLTPRTNIPGQGGYVIAIHVIWSIGALHRLACTGNPACWPGMVVTSFDLNNHINYCCCAWFWFQIIYSRFRLEMYCVVQIWDRDVELYGSDFRY